MKRKILSICTAFMIAFSMTVFSFADTDVEDDGALQANKVEKSVEKPKAPEKPKVNDYHDNDKIKKYNSEAKDYNKKVDEYNAEVDKRYKDAVADTNQKNAEGRAKQRESQQAHDEAVAANEAEQARVDSENAKIDEQNAAESERVNKHNSDEDAKVEQSKKDKADIEAENASKKEAYDAEVEAAEKEYEDAVAAEKERIEAIKAENEQIRKHNAAEDQKVADTEAANQVEKERIDAENAERESKYLEDVAKYEADMDQYNSDYEQYEKDKAMEEKILSATDAYGNPRYQSVEEYNQAVEEYNGKVTNYNNSVDSYNKAYNINDEIVNNSPDRNKNANAVSIDSTYEITEGKTKSGRTIPVKIKHTFYGTDISYEEEFEIDANDTIVLKGMSVAGDCLDEQSCCFFYNTDDNHTLGMWNNSWSVLMVNPTADSVDGWQNGDTHTITYKDSTNEYQWNFEDIEVEYYYMWTPFYKKKDLYEYANTPNEPTKPTEPTLELLGFEPITYEPNYLDELDETENVIEKRTVDAPEYKDVPSIYTPEYEEYNPVSYISPVLIDVPDVEEWNELPDPVKEKYLNRIPMLDLLALPDRNPADKPTPTATPTVTPTTINTDVVTVAKKDESKNMFENKVPLVTRAINPVEESYWALVNLIAMLLSVIMAIILGISAIINKRKEDETLEINNKYKARIMTAIVAVISAIVFFFTEDITLPWTWVDSYTPIMIVLTIITLLFAILARHKEKEVEENVEE